MRGEKARGGLWKGKIGPLRDSSGRILFCFVFSKEGKGNIPSGLQELPIPPSGLYDRCVKPMAGGHWRPRACVTLLSVPIHIESLYKARALQAGESPL